MNLIIEKIVLYLTIIIVKSNIIKQLNKYQMTKYVRTKTFKFANLLIKIQIKFIVINWIKTR